MEHRVLAIATSKKHDKDSSKVRSSTKSNLSGSQSQSGIANSTQSQTTVMFCKAYQSGKCNKSSPHSLNMGKKQFSVHHICATCWLVDKEKRDHPESAKECKYYGKTVQEAKDLQA